MRDLWSVYHETIPDFMKEFMAAKQMRRIDQIDMNCGMNYTAFLDCEYRYPYSRFDHSAGVALIIWHFTKDEKQTLSGLFHDISTPVFSHVIDFMNHDHIRQESTEDRTKYYISQPEISCLLDEKDIRVDEVSDYHMYPIADNDSPKLSADRLEYTLGNLFNFGFRTTEEIRCYYNDLIVTKNEEGTEELCFQNEDTAIQFALDALRCGMIYSSDEHRFGMESLAVLVRNCLNDGILKQEDLYLGEQEVIAKICASPRCSEWRRFRELSAVIQDKNGMIINAKKRYIDPLCFNGKRVSQISGEFAEKLKQFMAMDYSVPLKGM